MSQPQLNGSPVTRFAIRSRLTSNRGDVTDVTSPQGGSPQTKGGYDNRTVQELLGHKDVRTTMPVFKRYGTHVLNRGGRGVRSPADGLARDPDERYVGS